MHDWDKKINNINDNYNLDFLEDINLDKFLLWRKLIFSDVLNFDSNNYVFFTHSVQIRTKSNEYYRKITENNNAYSPIEDSYDIAFNPNDLKKKKRISVSLTTSEDNYTYGRIGYIVSAPVENILYVGQAPFDKTNDELRRMPLKMPQDAKKDMFHEVILEGSTIYGIVKPVAIFINLSGATEEEITKTILMLEQIQKETGGIFPIIDLSSPDYNLKSGKRK